MSGALAVALVHHPVLDRNAQVVTTAVTNLDIHDIARTARTYGVAKFFLVTPVLEQKRLAARILSHWREGFGAGYNRDRGDALSLVEMADSLPEAIEAWRRIAGSDALPMLTGARVSNGMSFAQCRRLLAERPLLLVLGTGWGLAPQLFCNDWPVLEPVSGTGDYNHLSVRAAAAIIVDRLLGSG